MVAARDGVSEQDAAQYVDEVGLLAAQARAEHAALPDAPPLVAENRARFLERAALARQWMTQVFEPAHQAQHIPDGDPLLDRALASPKHVRPELYGLCQLVAVPSGFGEDRDGLLAKAADPQWQAAAKARMDTVAERLRRYVRADDPQSCRLFGKLMRFEDKDDGTVKLSVESKAFHLDACAKPGPGDTCEEPKWAPEWVDAVRPHTETGFIPVFRTRFGYHLVFLVEVMEAAPLDDPATVTATREAILDPWRAAALDQRLDALRKKWAVRVHTGDMP